MTTGVTTRNRSGGAVRTAELLLEFVEGIEARNSPKRGCLDSDAAVVSCLENAIRLAGTLLVFDVGGAGTRNMPTAWAERDGRSG